MRSFLEDVIDDVLEKHVSLNQLTFVLPSKRAGVFLRKYLAERIDKPIFAPSILSIEDFIGQLSRLSPSTQQELLLTLYESLTTSDEKPKEDFLSFLGWAHTLLQDFNEIDRYLLDYRTLFNYLSEIHRIKNWNLKAEKTPLVEGYVKFWQNAHSVYESFTQKLIEEGKAYQGLAYRQASNNIDGYIETNGHKHLFIGFNALNTAETQIVQAFLAKGNADIYWDLDSYFLNDPVHDAGLFIRRYKKGWPYFSGNPLKGITDNFLGEKSIKITGVPKNIAQAKYVGQLLETINTTNPGQLNNMALVLADESLLVPILHALPKEIAKVNVTMGLSLADTPLYDFFTTLMNLSINRSKHGWYHKDIQLLLANPYAKILLHKAGNSYVSMLKSKIFSQNLTYLSLSHLRSDSPDQNTFISMFFAESLPNPRQFINNCLKAILSLKKYFEKEKNALELQQLEHFHSLFTTLHENVLTHSFLNNIAILKQLLAKQVSDVKLDFQGDSIKGLQILGMLESRNLDFETVVITSVNEGILPTGKTNSSFIPFDVKKEFGLPTHKEKDAIYTYHFYRLLQRAKNIHLLYNTEIDTLEGGEKSRLLTQLLTDVKLQHYVEHNIASPIVSASEKFSFEVPKTPGLLDTLKILAEKGFSPSALANYIENPLGFYKKNVLKIKETDGVEENIAANTFGTIVHDALEVLYRPFENSFLTTYALEETKKKIAPTVEEQFLKWYSPNSLKSGQTLIVFNVITKYLQNLIDNEISDAEQHEIKILGIEKEVSLDLDIQELGFPVTLKGKIDRIDEKDGQLRILDYKTGRVISSEVEITDMKNITQDPSLGKAFQLLCYSLLYAKESTIGHLTAGIIPVKKINPEPIMFALKPSARSQQKEHLIDATLLDRFKSGLKELIVSLFNVDAPFVEEEA
ncbi:PD-(D/E)XK nuclease family protein [Allomuricauda sp. SCSIO 65647]|uniref:PD-(D/E)XK nuclease family protein n=1 Tax=Allomuricauda sp. SCSIO 65647 TaxID=2908843 RepID=UPI001F175BAE|nr:PD-(D/E)XK nuclease family protein [Muricauda sp. SCSIO 65647]UJH69210.1 PD-(D/E)XK nuclease family protein [Muricauda sp. SCSIO 65647]